MENANIVIITDDDSYEAIENVTTEELKNLGSNRISLVQVGEKIRSIKTELTRGIVATSGDVIIL